MNRLIKELKLEGAQRAVAFNNDLHTTNFVYSIYEVFSQSICSTDVPIRLAMDTKTITLTFDYLPQDQPRYFKFVAITFN